VVEYKKNNLKNGTSKSPCLGSKER